MFIDNLLFQDKKGGSSLFVGAGLLRQKTCGQVGKWAPSLQL